MTVNMPPPPQPAGTNWLRTGGIIMALSAPISGLVLYAVVAILVGEERLEDDGGLTALGLLPFAVPVVIGGVLVALSYTGRAGPSRTMIGLGVGGLAVLCAAVGLLSLLTAEAGDASIGGGVLILAAVALGGLAVGLIRAAAASSGD